jgi:hypothetical protein
VLAHEQQAGVAERSHDVQCVVRGEWVVSVVQDRAGGQGVHGCCGGVHIIGDVSHDAHPVRRDALSGRWLTT